MKSKPYKFYGKLFRYDFDLCIVEYIAKAGPEEVADNAEWLQTHKKPLFNIDADGYMVISSIGLYKDNWTKKIVRDEYLSEWCFDLDDKSAALAADFVKYELPYLNRGESK